MEKHSTGTVQDANNANDLVFGLDPADLSGPIQAFDTQADGQFIQICVCPRPSMPQDGDDVDVLEEVAMLAASALDKADAWSVDFAQGKDGKWGLIDVADARISWRPDDCDACNNLPDATRP